MCKTQNEGETLKKDEEKLLQAGEVLLEVAKSEYQNEFERSSVIDTKVGIALPVVAAYFFANLNAENIGVVFSKEMECLKVVTVLSFVIHPVSYLLSLIFAIASLEFLLRAIFTQTYSTVDPSYFNESKYLKHPKSVLSAVLVKFYVESIKHNKCLNDKKVVLYNRGLNMAILSLTCFFVYFVTK